MLRWLLTTFIATVILSACWPWLSRFGVGRLPGDLSFKIGHWRINLPLMSTLVITIVVMLLVRIF
jgi:uncharacterized membrane-anchored protein